jgi:hypothetical protein
LKAAVLKVQAVVNQQDTGGSGAQKQAAQLCAAKEQAKKAQWVQMPG